MGNISRILILCLGLSVYLFQKIVFNYMAFNLLIVSAPEGYPETLGMISTLLFQYSATGEE